jgi:3-phenylpropionate/trans-cinnamate dioxygenase ferredoxin reductase component
VNHFWRWADEPWVQVSGLTYLSMEYRGHASPSDRLVIRGDPATGAFIAFWLADGRVTAGMNANLWDVGKPIEALIRSRARVDTDALADPAMPLDEVGRHAARPA